MFTVQYKIISKVHFCTMPKQLIAAMQSIPQNIAGGNEKGIDAIVAAFLN